MGWSFGRLIDGFIEMCWQILEKDRSMQLGDDDRDRDRVVLDKPAPGRTERKINCCWYMLSACRQHFWTFCILRDRSGGAVIERPIPRSTVSRTTAACCCRLPTAAGRRLFPFRNGFYVKSVIKAMSNSVNVTIWWSEAKLYIVVFWLLSPMLFCTHRNELK